MWVSCSIQTRHGRHQRNAISSIQQQTCITPYEGLDVHRNSTEGIKLKPSHDKYEGAEASGEGTSKSLTMSHTQRGLKDRELMYGLMLILIARILMKVSHLYKDSVASY